jgi:hypothetical protein
MELSGTQSIIDIAVYRAGTFLAFIENKTISPDTPGQHDREFADLHRMGDVLGVPEDRRVAIYLTPYGRRALGEHADVWRRVAYRGLGRALGRMLPALQGGGAGLKTRLLLEDWLATIQDFGGLWREGMTTLSPESVLLGANWPAVLAMIDARERLDRELLELLFGLEPLLARQAWWHAGWGFRRAKSWFYVRNDRWTNADNYAVLTMGVAEFSAAHVFGPGGAPTFYMWVRKNHPALKDALLAALKAEGHAVRENTGTWCAALCSNARTTRRRWRPIRTRFTRTSSIYSRRTPTFWSGTTI